MNDDNDNNDECGHNDARGARSPRRDGYRSPRKPKLRGAVEPRPPRLPKPGEEYLYDEFGSAAEDGLRMLAALETMPSLEPDFGDDPSAEAAVTIVEQTGAGSGGTSDKDVASAQNVRDRSLRARLDEMASPFDADADYDPALLGPIEEATVEIVEVRKTATDNDFAAFAPESAPSRAKGRKPGRA
jgi:hypothetical protein